MIKDLRASIFVTADSKGVTRKSDLLANEAEGWWYPTIFVEVVVKEGLIFSRVKKMWDASGVLVEKKGVSGSPRGGFCKVSEEAVNKGLRKFMRWARVG